MVNKHHNPFTIHMRMTKACNADCSYCSSWLEDPMKRMKPDEFKVSIDNIISLIQKLQLNITHVSLQYIGGEILTIPTIELEECVYYARKKFSSNGYEFRDGVQSNLIGSENKVKNLFNLFEDRVGTSIDSFSNARTVKGSKEKYDLIFTTRDQENTDKLFRTPAIYTFDSTMLDNVRKEIEKAEKDNRNLTIKGVFAGGKDINKVASNDYEKVMLSSLENWFLKSNIILEPFYSLLEKHISNNYENSQYNMEACHFQSNCASRSINIDPDGSIYICQDLADKGFGKLGNILSDDFDNNMWTSLNGRTEMLDESCLKCPYFKTCRSGCMVDSIESGSGIYGKSPYCSLWTNIFKFYDKKIEELGLEAVNRWKRRLSAFR